MFVDRETELGVLADAWAHAAAGRGQVVVIEGEAGVGKTTLVECFLADLEGVRILRAGGEESESHVPFATADQLLRAGGGTALGASSHVQVGLDLLELIGAAPTVVVADDAHLVDAESLRALLFAARRLSGSATLFTVVVRGAAQHALPEGWEKLARRVLEVTPLLPAHVSALAAHDGLKLTPEASNRLWLHTNGNPLHLRAVLRELPADDAWQHEQRPLPVPASYAQLVRRRLERCERDVAGVIEAAAVIGVRAPLHAVLALVDVEHALERLDDAIASGLVELDDRWVRFPHPLTRAAIYEAIPIARRARLNLAAVRLAPDPGTALRHRVEAAAGADETLVADLESHARAETARGAWASAVSSLLAASRLSTTRGERERFTLEAIEATMYSGDGAAARRLAEQAEFADGPRRDSVLAYLAIFAGDVETAQRLLDRAWERRAAAGDERLEATIAQRSAFLATSRLRGREAIEWTDRALALAPGDPTTGLLVAPSRALGLSFTGSVRDAHAALDRWLDDPSASPRGYVLLAVKGALLLADGDLGAARAAFETSAGEGLRRGLLVVAALSLSGLARVHYLAGAWNDAVVAGERALALAVESDDRWVVGQAHWAASLVPAARGDWDVAEGHVRAIRQQHPAFERHIATAALAAAGVEAARRRPAEVLRALAPLEQMRHSDGVDDPAFYPWHHLKAHALADLGEVRRAEQLVAHALALARSRSNPLLAARIACVRARLAGGEGALRDALAIVEPLAMPYERAQIELALGQVLRRAGERRAAAALLTVARDRLAALDAGPLLQRCERELAACGLSPSARKTRDESALTPQERAVARLVVSGMTNREVAEELMLSSKTVEFHLSNVYAKLGVRSRSQLRARARADELPGLSS